MEHESPPIDPAATCSRLPQSAKAIAKRSIYHRWVAVLVMSLGLAVTSVVSSVCSSRHTVHVALELDRIARQEMDGVVARMENLEHGIRGTRGAILVGGQEHIREATYRLYAESRDLKVEFPGVRSFGFIRREGDRDILQFVSTATDSANLIGLDIAAEAPLRAVAEAAIESRDAKMTPSFGTLPGRSKPDAWCLVMLPVYRPHIALDTNVQRHAATIGWAFAAIDLGAVLGAKKSVDDIEFRLEDVTEPGAGTQLTSAGRLQAHSVATASSPVTNLYGRHWQLKARAGPAFEANFISTPPNALLAIGGLLSLLAAALAAVFTVHQQRRTELQSQQALLATVVANAIDAIIIESPDGIVLNWNDAASDMFGWRAEEATGQRFADLILLETMTNGYTAFMTGCANGTRVGPFDGIGCRRDGRSVNLSITAVPVIGSDRRLVAIAKTIRDVTARKAAERVLEVSRETLERQFVQRAAKLDSVERDLSAITDALPSMIAYWDKDQVNRFANHAHQKWYGMDNKAMAGMRLQDCASAAVYETMRPHVEAVLRGELVTYEREHVWQDDRATATLQVHYIPDILNGNVRGFYVLSHDISAIKSAQRRVAESEILLEQAGAVSGVGGFRIDLTSGSQFWTRQTFSIYDMEGEFAPSSEELDKLMDPEVGARLWQAIRVASETGIGYDLEIPMRTARGRAIWIRTIGVVELENGRPMRVVGAVQDTTERKNIEEALRVTTERFALATDAAKIGVWEWDLLRDTINWDDQMYALYGHARDDQQVVYSLWIASIHPEDRERAQREVTAALSGDSVFDSEFRITQPSGSIRHIKATARTHFNAAGLPVRMVGINVDITDRKSAEQALSDSELKFRMLFQMSPVGIALYDLQTGQYLDFNEALLSPTGYTRNELMGLTYRDITPTEYGDRDAVAINSLEQKGSFTPYEKDYRRKDGSTYTVLMSGIRAREASGRDVAWSLVQDISARRAMEQAVADTARRDQLTGLANRALFMSRLEHSIARINHHEQHFFAVLFLDFDRFKLINDTLGHEAGDELLRQIAQRLRTTLRASDALTLDGKGNVVSRFGGDEFLLLVNELKAPEGASRIAERLLNALAPPYDIQGTEVHSSASIGIVTSDQCHTNAEEVVRNADVAMYEAKRAGRACSVVFNEAMYARLTRHATIENSLRRAIGTTELHLVYQPIVDLSNNKMASAEALVRWTHPTLGDITPSEFIPIAEESALIIALGQWVQNEACKAMAHWRRHHPARAPKTISVNVSRAELALGSRLLAQVVATLDRHGLPAECLQLEVTEREIMRHPEAARALMLELQRKGIKLAMDDFGTGTSSLGILRNYPFDTIKIDRTFLQDVTRSSDVLAVIHATVNLVENLGMASVAEGVEDAAQVAILQSLGCRHAQGYYFSRPVAPEFLLDSLDTQVQADA